MITPGPYRVTRAGCAVLAGDDDNPIVVADCNPRDWADAVAAPEIEIKDNATLFAAAPKMLAALKEIEQITCPGPGSHVMSHDTLRTVITRCWQAAGPAIAEASGQS